MVRHEGGYSNRRSRSGTAVRKKRGKYRRSRFPFANTETKDEFILLLPIQYIMTQKLPIINDININNSLFPKIFVKLNNPTLKHTNKIFA